MAEKNYVSTEDGDRMYNRPPFRVGKLHAMRIQPTKSQTTAPVTGPEPFVRSRPINKSHSDEH